MSTQNTQSRTRCRARIVHPSLALALLAMLALPLCAFAQDAATKTEGVEATAEEVESMSLKGDEEDTVLKSLVIEGEDRIQIEFERPELDLHIDGYGIEGLRWGETMDVVQRREVDALTPMIHDSNDGRAKGLARPYLRQLRNGSVARFRPKMDDVASWRLTIADSRGDTVRVFSGKGSLPEQIEWDGVNDNGELALPGLVYSYVLEAKDKAGNRRNFVGPGFEVAPYRIEKNGRFNVVISGKSLLGPGAATRPVGMSDPWVLEAASWMNQYCAPDQTIEIHVSARNFEMAEAMGEIVRVQMAEQLPGSPLRLRVTTEASSEAPPAGVVTIGAEI